MTSPLPKSILLVEDEFLVRDVLADELRDAGYQVTEAATAQEALSSLPKGFDVLLTDIRMPGNLSGWDVAEAVRAQCANTKIIYMTGYTSDGRRQVPNSQILLKPCTAAQVLALLQKDPIRG